MYSCEQMTRVHLVYQHAGVFPGNNVTEGGGLGEWWRGMGEKEETRREGRGVEGVWSFSVYPIILVCNSLISTYDAMILDYMNRIVKLLLSINDNHYIYSCGTHGYRYI